MCGPSFIGLRPGVLAWAWIRNSNRRHGFRLAAEKRGWDGDKRQHRYQCLVYRYLCTVNVVVENRDHLSRPSLTDSSYAQMSCCLSISCSGRSSMSRTCIRNRDLKGRIVSNLSAGMCDASGASPRPRNAVGLTSLETQGNKKTTLRMGKTKDSALCESIF